MSKLVNFRCPHATLRSISIVLASLLHAICLMLTGCIAGGTLLQESIAISGIIHLTDWKVINALAAMLLLSALILNDAEEHTTGRQCAEAQEQARRTQLYQERYDQLLFRRYLLYGFVVLVALAFCGLSVMAGTWRRLGASLITFAVMHWLFVIMRTPLPGNDLVYPTKLPTDEDYSLRDIAQWAATPPLNLKKHRNLTRFERRMDVLVEQIYHHLGDSAVIPAVQCYVQQIGEQQQYAAETLRAFQRCFARPKLERFLRNRTTSQLQSYRQFIDTADGLERMAMLRRMNQEDILPFLRYITWLQYYKEHQGKIVDIHEIIVHDAANYHIDLARSKA